MSDVLYTTEKQCVMCDQKITVTKVRNRLTMVTQDSDFCCRYQEVNPYYYAIWVCPHCGYAAQDAYFDELPGSASTIKAFLAGREVNVDFSGPRTYEDAVATYKLALFFAEMAGTLSSRLGGLYLKLAWLFREAGRNEEELAALEQARQNYEKAYMRERLPIGNMTQIMLEYLIGELFRRTGKLPEALNYLGKIVTNPQAKQERRVLELARNAWNEARELQKQAKAAAVVAEAAE